MAYGNVIKVREGVAVGASATDTQVSRPFTPADPMNIQVTVQLSSVSESAGITLKLKDSADGTTYADVGDQSQATLVKKAFAAGTKEVSTVTYADFATTTQADYLHLTAQDGTTVAIWADKDANGTAPTGALYVAADIQIEVDIVTGDTATVHATAAFTEIADQLDGLFTVVDNENGTLTFTQVMGGAVADPAPKNADDSGAGSIAVVVDTAGSNGDVTLATNLITENSHGFATGERVIPVGSDVPAGLTSGTTYYAIATDANSYKFADSYADALAGTAVDITDYGSGTVTTYRAEYEIRMIEGDATDLAQLPVRNNTIVVVSSGASDSCTVSAIYTRYTP